MLKYLFYLTLFSVILGPAVSLSLGIPAVNIYLTDILVGSLTIFWLLNIRKLIPLLKQNKIFHYFSFFVLAALISLFLSPIPLTFSERSISFLYLIRFTAYFSLYPTVLYLLQSKNIKTNNLINSLGLAGIGLAIFGWLGYFLYPDLRNLYYLGWDPHYKRIFGSFFDPNYFGLMMVLSLIILFTWKESLRNTFQVAEWTSGRWILIILTFISLMFTYSRSSYFALLATIFFYSIFKKKYILIGGAFIILIFSALILPRPGGVGVQLERIFSIEQRIENWKEGFKIFTDYPILGIGFNSVRYAKKQYGLGGEDLLVSHSGAGFDNSFLFVGVTTGLIGLLCYFFLLKQIYNSSGLLLKTSLIAIIVHSFFLNSLFFPWVMLWLWTIIGIKRQGE